MKYRQANMQWNSGRDIPKESIKVRNIYLERNGFGFLRLIS